MDYSLSSLWQLFTERKKKADEGDGSTRFITPVVGDGDAMAWPSLYQYMVFLNGMASKFVEQVADTMEAKQCKAVRQKS